MATIDDLTFTLSSDGTYYFVSAASSSISGALEIPAEYNGLPVTGINWKAFYQCTGLTSVTIPSSITSIGVDTFSYCTGLTSITVESGNTVYHSDGNCCIKTTTNTLIFGCKNSVIPDYVTSIGYAAFYGCTGLTSVTIPSSVTSIGDNAFYNCTGLTSLTIPFSVTSIGDSAFYYCTGLTSVTIPSSVTSIGDGAFYYCTGLTSVTIPSSVTSIGRHVFSYCTGLTSITVESGNTVYHSDGNCCIKTETNILVFGCKTSTIPDYVTSIGYSAFSSCKGLTSVTIPSSVTSIGDYAFSSCTGLTSITIPSSVTSIGYQAFNYCTGLTSITIPSSTTSIGDYAFSRCTGLTYFKFEGDVIEESNNVINNTPNLECVYVNVGTKGWGETWGGKPVVKIGSNIGNAVKYGETPLIEIKLGEITIYSMFIGDDQLF